MSASQETAPQPQGGTPGQQEVVMTDKARVACDGGGALGHPRVYLDLGADGKVECGYCGRLFVKAD